METDMTGMMTEKEVMTDMKTEGMTDMMTTGVVRQHLHTLLLCVTQVFQLTISTHALQCLPEHRFRCLG